ncbi:hypothetical protein [Mucilaginibacter gilvus]|uniref:Uncharacterized protein n=1 Tax=Mucilaginibacter gilvus TaxID=2305909 RepID=A0A3S3UZ63_9SPHI|nr:hypothetical protein [Mucilaginibacter gilvus]RWY54187.1 hypothetical protein EPL05_09095 [Mucilaginibacter gilvus]
MNGEIPLDDFEQWVYNNKELEELLSPDQYFNLISFSYSKAGARHELINLLTSLAGMGRYETYKLRKLIAMAMLRDQNLPKYLTQFYDLYCDGYYFLRRFGLGFGLSMFSLPADYISENWNELDVKQTHKLIDSITPELEQELRRILNWLDNDEIVLTGEKDELDRYDYIDNRSAVDRKNDDIFPLFFYINTSKPPWWQFWR